MSAAAKTGMNARDAAFAALKRVSGGAYSSIALDEVLGGASLSREDAALASALFYGVLENEKTLDSAIEKCLSKPGQRIKKDVRIILRMGIYQLGFMDRIPDRAAVDQSVALAKKKGLAGLSGFVNAVLRGYIRQRGEGSNKAETASMCPDWLTELWRGTYGEENAAKLAAGISGRPPIFARVNTVRYSADELAEKLKESGAECSAIEWLPGAVELRKTGSISRLQPYLDGMFHVQDISSQLCCMALAPKAGERILDVCSAPGGKAFTAAELMADAGEVIACDLHPHRVELIAAGARRMGLVSVKAVVRDALCSDGITADRVLCDVPCSGLGVLRRKPDVIKKTREEIAGLPELQYNILSSAARSVKSGGVLVYSTCTLNPGENAGVVERFLAENSGFEPCELELPDIAGSAFDEPAFCRTLFPHTAGGDGFFIAKLRRKQ